MKTASDPRHQSRRLAVGAIYSVENSEYSEYSKLSNDDLIDTISESLEITNYDKKMYKDIIEGVTTNINNIKAMIELNSTDWKIENIYKTDLAVLLLSTWELEYGNTPSKVVVDEAVELAKEFGDTDSPKFINGVLAGIISKKNGSK